MKEASTSQCPCTASRRAISVKQHFLLELALHKAQGSYPIMQTSCLKHVLFSLIQNTCRLAHNAAVRLLHQDAAWP
jgi:hypothetical protein